MALRNLSSDGALTRKETQWPIPLTPRFYHSWVLEVLESIWDFDPSAFIMLGEAGVGKSPLGRSVLMAQAPWSKAHYQIEAEPCIRRTPGIDFLRGEQGSKVMGDQQPQYEDGQGFPWVCMNLCAGLGRGLLNGSRVNLAQ